jgi:hypothetical protein
MPTETAQPLFVALPLLSSSPTSGVAGVWRSKAKIAEGPDFDFELRLTGDGTTLTATTDEPNLKGKGTLREDQLELRLDKEGEVHWLQARLVGLELNGTWRKEDGPHGTWTARRIEPGPPERSSPAVVPLYEHRGATGERRAYSLRPEPAAGFTGAEPLARVWKPVASVLTLDWQTRPRGDNTK